MGEVISMKVDIISKENVKPASPTPLHLRRYKLSILDQIFPHTYMPGVIFYLSDIQNTTPSNFFPIKSNHLKQTLSQTLTRYYPFAGKLRDDLNYIDCNDEGVYYVEAKVSYGLKEFLSQPDVQLIQLLTPNNPLPLESMSGNYVFLVQVNIFDCGGLAIGTCGSHKIADGATSIAFMNAWSRLAACGSLEEVHNPIFIAPSLFPPNSSILCKWPFKESEKNESVTRRFVFHGTALAALRAQAASISHVQYPTSVEAVAALIWSCAIEAIPKVTNKGPKQASIFAVPVNLRTRMRQVLPKSSMGNLIWFAFAQHMPDDKLEFPCIVDRIRKVFAKVDSDFIEGIQGKEGYAKVSECLKEYAELLHDIDMDNCLILTSLRKAGITEIDFGWGKPSWYYFCNPGFKNFVFLMDTRSGDGIEALSCYAGEFAVYYRPIGHCSLDDYRYLPIHFGIELAEFALAVRGRSKKRLLREETSLDSGHRNSMTEIPVLGQSENVSTPKISPLLTLEGFIECRMILAQPLSPVGSGKFPKVADGIAAELLHRVRTLLLPLVPLNEKEDILIIAELELVMKKSCTTVIVPTHQPPSYNLSSILSADRDSDALRLYKPLF
ncbi:hypothetical protein RJ639_025611 [Escallonia herrerae]|uniref:BAHD acyltransferase n=1 Tax=Escallonia herrerae TaxID=1293975 RepID=A0AA88UXU2_9ASTE|nr:hypothetical protein RJ639_025611 [Escallonia herrerae]